MLKKSCTFLCALCLGLGCLFTGCSDDDIHNRDGYAVDFNCINQSSACSCKGNGVHCLSDDIALTCKDGVLNRIKCTEKACNANSACIGESFNNEGDNEVPWSSANHSGDAE